MMIKKTDINSILESGESESIEFKCSFDNAAIETLSAFANTKGGLLILGVSDMGKTGGIILGKETIPKWINEIKLKTNPSIIPDVEIKHYEGKIVVVLAVDEYPIKPVACKGRYYKRVKNSNHLLSVSEVADMHLKTFNASWDYHIDNSHTTEDISFDKVNKFIELANKNRETPIKDKAAMAFIKKHINKEFIISGNAQREEAWEYPLDALREIVINSIVHRDYSRPSDSVIKIFNDKIEFYNPGKLPAGLTVAKLIRGDYVSSIRNKQIADIFKEAGVIEKYGSGIRRILDAFKKKGLKSPKFKEIGDGFMVIVYKEIILEKVGEKLSKNQIKIIEAIINDRFVSAVNLAKLVGISPRKIEENIKKLKSFGVLRRIGPAKGGRWEIVKGSKFAFTLPKA